MAEVATQRKDAAVDAGLFFALEKGISAGLATEPAIDRGRAEVKRPQVPETRVVVPAQIRFSARYCRLDGGIGGVDAGGAKKLKCEESR